MSELRSPIDVANWLAAGLCLRRIHGSNDDILVAQSIIACANDMATLPPPGVVADVVALLSGVNLPILTSPPDVSDDIRSSIRSYDDDILSRLSSTPRFDDLISAFSHLTPAEQPSAVAIVVAAICKRAVFSGLAVNPAALRNGLSRVPSERDSAGWIELQSNGLMAENIRIGYFQLARGARQVRSLVDDREVFMVNHVSVLRDFGSRTTSDHIIAATDAIKKTFPRRIPRNRDQRGLKDTKLADDSLYPAGGFTSITPGGASTGNIENLVTSELVYMEDGVEVDLFSLRYLEGELLHYTRDDSVLRRHRHSITFLLSGDLEKSRVKDNGVAWQRLMLGLGTVVAVSYWLIEQLGEQALSIHIVFPPNLLTEERRIVALLLGGEVSRGIVVIDEQDQDVALKSAANEAGSITDVIIVSNGSLPTLPKGLRTTGLSLAKASPAITELSPRLAEVKPADPNLWASWGDGAEELLRWLV